MQRIDWALFLALAKAGNAIAAIIGSINRAMPEVQMPAIANPEPSIWPLLLRIFTSDTIAVISPNNEVRPQVRKPRMPSTIDATARPLCFGLEGAAEENTGGVVGKTGGSVLGASAPANSGNAESGFQSALPSACTSVWALARPSPIQRRRKSALTGP